MLMWMADYFIVAVALLATHAKAMCPQGCTCSPQYVNCHNAGLRAVPWNLPNPIGLKVLDLSGNPIRELLSEIVSYRKLESLDLSNCDIGRVNYGVFRSLISLKMLNLKNNRIELKNTTFIGLSSLEALDLSGNNLEHLPNNVFTKLTQLVDFNLANNKLRLYPDSFAGLTRLESLSLGTNQLYAIPTAALLRVPNLITLKMAENYISHVEKEDLNGFLTLRTLTLDENDIEEIDEDAFKACSSLEFISLRNNSLRIFPTAALDSVRQLVSLDMSENLFSVIDPDALKGHGKLRNLSLSSLPKLEVVRSYAFSELTNLEKLYMHSNRYLHTIEENAFLGSSNVKYIDFSNNDLRTLHEHLFQWDTLDYLDLSGNSWSCDCHLKYILAHSKLVDHHGNDTVLCATPPELSSKPISSIEGEDFICDVQMEKLENEKFQDSIMIAIIAGVSGILLIVLCVMMMQSRHTFFGTSYQMQVSYHEYHVASDSRSSSRINDLPPGLRQAARANRAARNGRRLYRVGGPSQPVRQTPRTVPNGTVPNGPLPRVPRSLGSVSRNPALDIIEEEEAISRLTESEDRDSMDNLVVSVCD